MILSAADGGLTVNTHNTSSYTFTLNGTSTDLAVNKVMIVCDPWLATIFRVSSYTPSPTNPVIGYGSTTANFSTDLSIGYPLPLGVSTYTYGANSPIAALAAGVWYIGYNGVTSSSTSLYLASVSTTTNPATVTDQEMVRGVTAMSITYNMANTTTFVPAASVTNWSSVVAVQVSLTVQQTSTTNAGISATSSAAVPIYRTYTVTSTVRNRVN
jgi:hypothetical protein